jgi:hypothetical protein
MELDQRTKDLLTRWAQWELGDGSWSRPIIDLIEDPDGTEAYLDEEEAD